MFRKSQKHASTTKTHNGLRSSIKGSNDLTN